MEECAGDGAEHPGSERPGGSMTVVFIGHGRSGKDTACEILAELTGWVNAGTVSKYLTKYVAASLGIDEATAYLERHARREFWRSLADTTREKDPAMFVREMLSHGPIGGGIRGAVEFEAARREGLIDLAVWIDRDVPVDP